ncbi:MAG: hypothetical protein ACR2NT_15570, partial [Acidimicrobiia bacterium]
DRLRIRQRHQLRRQSTPTNTRHGTITMTENRRAIPTQRAEPPFYLGAMRPAVAMRGHHKGRQPANRGKKSAPAAPPFRPSAVLPPASEGRIRVLTLDEVAALFKQISSLPSR